MSNLAKIEFRTSRTLNLTNPPKKTKKNRTLFGPNLAPILAELELQTSRIHIYFSSPKLDCNFEPKACSNLRKRLKFEHCSKIRTNTKHISEEAFENYPICTILRGHCVLKMEKILQYSLQRFL